MSIQYNKCTHALHYIYITSTIEVITYANKMCMLLLYITLHDKQSNISNVLFEYNYSLSSIIRAFRNVQKHRPSRRV